MLQKQLCELLTAGNTIKTSCDATGISERSFHDWCEKKPAFLAATTRARATAKIKLVAIVTAAAKIDARHAQWLLERGWPGEYGRAWREPWADQSSDAVGVTMVFNTGGKSPAELLNFPVMKKLPKARAIADPDADIDDEDAEIE